VKHDPIHDFRSGSVRNTQAIRDLKGHEWAYEPRINWSGIGKALAVFLVLVALVGMFVVTPA
jgi:hypothetical protein